MAGRRQWTPPPPAPPPPNSAAIGVWAEGVGARVRTSPLPLGHRVKGPTAL